MGYGKYKQDMLDRFKVFREKNFLGRDELFYERHNHVFNSEFAEYNLFKTELDKLLPRKRRHRWYGSMGSSQALALSVFGTMMQHGDLRLLADVSAYDGTPLLPNFDLDGHPEFDFPISTLNEPTPTHVDLFLPGQKGNVAVECKLWEDGLDPCSQVAKKRCNGNYEEPTGRKPGERCYLTERGVSYWDYIPRIFKWRSDMDHSTCPIWKPYQLVRNVLAASVGPQTGEVLDQPTAVLIYDSRNPAFAPGGKADYLFREVQEALEGSASLKRATWQSIVATLNEQGGYEGLLNWLVEKYGIHEENYPG